MSEKRVNIKITASTSGLESAIKKAQKQMESLTKTGEKLGKSKFGDDAAKQFKDMTKESKKSNKSLKDISKQFKNIEKASKSTDKQLKNNSKSLKALSKTKLDNITKQFEKIIKSAKQNDTAIKKMQKTINSIKAKTIESVNKAMVSMSKGASTVSKGFTNIKNSINTISSRAISDVSNAVSSLSSKCPALANAFTKIKATIGGIQGKVFNTLSSTVSSLGGKVQTLGGKFNTLKANISNAVKTSWSNLTGNISNVSGKLSPLTNKFNTLKNKVKEVANNNFNKLTESTTKLNSEGTKSDNIFSKFGNKVKDIAGGALSNISSKLSGLTGINASFNGSLSSTIGTIAGVTAATKLSGNAYKSLSDRIKESGDKIAKYQSALSRTKAKYGENSEASKKWITKLNEEKQKLGEIYDALLKDKNARVEDVAAVEKLKKSINEYIDTQNEAVRVSKDWSSVTEDLSDAWDNFNSGDYGKAFKSLASAGKAAFSLMPGWTKACVAVVVALKKLYDAGKKRFFEGLSDIKNTFQPVVNIITSGIRQIKTAFESLTGMRLSFGSFIEIAVNYEDTMARVQAITGTTGKEFESLQDKARQMGATTRYSATEAGQAMIEMGQQGWKTEEILTGVEHVLNLATVGNIDLARSAEIVTNGLNAFGMEASDAQKYVDILAQASVSSGTSVEQMGEALENVASTAGALKIPIEDVAVGIGLMGNNFIKSGKAGTSMKTFLANMSDPSKKMTDIMSKYNLEGARQKILNGDLVGGYKDMAKSMEGLDNKQKAQIATTLAGKEGMAGFLSIVNSGVDGIEELEKSIENADNVAQHMAETFDATLKGALSNISSGIEEKVLQVFDKIKPTLTEAMKHVNKFFEIWNGFDKKGNGSGLTDALAYLEKQVKSSIPKISETVQNGISGIKDFITGGGFQAMLDIGSDIITGICDGIIESKDNLAEGIDAIIGKICDWVNKNGPQIQEAGAIILDAIKDGINNNREKIGEAAETIYGVINTWVSKKEGAISALGLACWDAFIGGIIKGKVDDVKEKIKNIFNPNKRVDYDPTSMNKVEASGFKSGNKDNTAEIKKSAKTTTDAYKEEVKKQLNDGTITKSASEAINKALNQGEEARKNASKTGQGYISELQNKLINGDISESAYSSILNGLKQSEAARKGASDTVNNYINSLETGLLNGSIDPSSVATVLSYISSSEEIRGSGSKLADEFLTAAQEGLASGQISPEDFNALVFGDIEANAKKWNDNGRQIGEGMTYGVEEALSSMNVEELRELQTEYENLAKCLDDVSAQMESSLSKISGTTRTEMVSCANITRNQFLNMANIVRNQCVNMSNIVRNQFVNISNIVNNQSQNARNNSTRSFISMKKVISTQVTESRTAVVSKFMSIAAVVNTQAWKARDNATRAFMSLAAVVRTQMAKALASVRSYMSQIAAATSKQMTMNFKVNKTVTTTNVTKSVSDSGAPVSLLRSAPALLSANDASTYSVGCASTYALSRAAASVSSGLSGSLSGISNRGQKDNVTLEIPVIVDGRQVAKASAKYMDGELKIINDRKNRYAGGVR